LKVTFAHSRLEPARGALKIGRLPGT
jgi:hypothetical protein